MSERDWITWLRSRVPQTAGLIIGIGDDCAVFRPDGSSEDLLFTTDMLVEGVHFRTADPPDVVGHRALARGLSDIAAMGGDPRFCLLSIARSARTSDEWLKCFYTGLLALAERTGAVLAGGDLSSAAQVTCDIVVCGATPRNTAIRRDGARPGDLLWVSGVLGGPSAAGFPATRFEPRLEFGRELRGVATSCIDITDGLALDLHRLCAASGCAAEIGHVPAAPGVSREHVLHGGEDYELLFTAPPGASVPTTAICFGSIVSGPPGSVTLDGVDVPPVGYDHFTKD
jgi:thiamine-monophosphate kinase